VSETHVSSTLTRFHLEGARGTAVATIILDDEGRWFGASLKRRVAEGIANIVLQCPWNEDRDAMSALYGDLLQLDSWDVPHLVFDEGAPDDPRPRWPDPAYRSRCTSTSASVTSTPPTVWSWRAVRPASLHSTTTGSTQTSSVTPSACIPPMCQHRCCGVS
jgi:hypothetical protein